MLRFARMDPLYVTVLMWGYFEPCQWYKLAISFYSVNAPSTSIIR